MTVYVWIPAGLRSTNATRLDPHDYSGSGLGLFIIETLMDEMIHSTDEGTTYIKKDAEWRSVGSKYKIQNDDLQDVQR